jgi:hypothetical protein
MSKTTKSAKTLRPCACSTFTAYNTEADVEYTTCCTAQTARTFAPGHDARLKGNLIRWAVLGYEIRVGDTTKDAVSWASSFGFGYMVSAGIRRSQERAAAKTEKLMKRIDKKAKAEVKPVTAKVGRWTYEGDLINGTFHYSDRQGVRHGTQNFKLV